VVVRAAGVYDEGERAAANRHLAVVDCCAPVKADIDVTQIW
jgi:hypothetical protein